MNVNLPAADLRPALSDEDPRPSRPGPSATGGLKCAVSRRLGAALVAGVAATAWTALTLAEFGRFVAIVPMLAFPAAAAAVFVLLSRGRLRRESRGRHPQDLLAVGIACATLFLTIPADELLLGGQDPGVYLHIAASVARTGSLILDEPDLAALTEEERQLVSRNHLGVYRTVPGHVSSARRQDLPAVLPPLPEPHGRRLVDRRRPRGAAGQPAAQRGGGARAVRAGVAAPRTALGAGGGAPARPRRPRSSGRPSSRPPSC